ncbi:ATP-binding cassette domain-containing protein [Pedobacter mucosus]|uniref:ATP-binding cassette domain-containing protein n=1 Tax=Pedobacter mucosus TaxID=2895286 RepID=UPI001EE48E7B|nr:ATP-binding cassette domain-containing protein [Pedobacter mucosus]UKT64260.1 ATP-binding cassette domain-containing protein [Pedobacter mucosus]
MIKIDVVKKIGGKYGNFELKVNTAFHLNAVTQISGPSGIGKTTLLKILAGLIVPDKGKIMVDDAVWFDEDKKHLKKAQDRQVGFVFQDYALFPNMTVKNHLEYGTNDLKYIELLLALGEMKSFENSYPKQLSGGQQQRLAILRALSTKPKLLLMDEPFSALDQELKSRLLPKLKQLFTAQRTTVIVVTHQENELRDYNPYTFKL